MANEIQKRVLMADDDDEDCLLASEAFCESGIEAIFSSVEDGIKLMDYLSGCLQAGGDELPDLILLDLNMPRKDGREALLEIRADPVLHKIPVVILTTSAEEKDIEFSMRAGADSFITKPSTFNEWVDGMKSLARCWLDKGEEF